MQRTMGSLGPRHVNVLMWLSITGSISVTELSSRLGVTLGTASLMVGELSRAGLVQRTEDDRDRRRTIIRISHAQRDEVENFLRARRAPLRRVLEQLSPAERAGFTRALRLLVDELTDTKPA